MTMPNGVPHHHQVDSWESADLQEHLRNAHAREVAGDLPALKERHDRLHVDVTDEVPG